MRDTTGNLPPLPGIFPDAMAPVTFNAPDRERELAMMRWGMPGLPQFGGAPITNIRNTASPHWRRWLGAESRRLVPATSFCEWADTKPRKTPVWFARDAERLVPRASNRQSGGRVGLGAVKVVPSRASICVA
jgi:putative SOS response-associated peptidase YedK